MNPMQSPNTGVGKKLCSTELGGDFSGTLNPLVECQQCGIDALIERKTIVYCTYCGCEWKKAHNKRLRDALGYIAHAKKITLEAIKEKK